MWEVAYLQRAVGYTTEESDIPSPSHYCLQSLRGWGLMGLSSSHDETLTGLSLDMWATTTAELISVTGMSCQGRLHFLTHLPILRLFILPVSHVLLEPGMGDIDPHLGVSNQSISLYFTSLTS